MALHFYTVTRTALEGISTVAVNKLLGRPGRAAMANRTGHAPAPESKIYAVFGRFLKS